MSIDFRPLNPILYRALERRFGPVLVADEGSAMVSTRAPSAFNSDRTNLVILAAGEYYKVCCPFCRDSRHRLWINHMYGQPDTSGFRNNWLAYCYNENCIDSPGRRQQLEHLIFGLTNRRERASAMPISPGRLPHF